MFVFFILSRLFSLVFTLISLLANAHVVLNKETRFSLRKQAPVSIITYIELCGLPVTIGVGPLCIVC